MSRLDWDRARKHRGFEPAIEPKREKPKGGWTHVKRQPVKVFTAEERSRWEAEREAA